jgi:hypothetical protein
MRRALVLGALTLLLAGAGQATTRGSGLYGTVTRGPITPVCVVGQPCDGPAAGVTLKFVRNGDVVGKVRTRSDGKYRIRLAPGSYSVRGGRSLEPTHVTVPRGRFRHVNFSIDTGIR